MYLGLDASWTVKLSWVECWLNVGWVNPLAKQPLPLSDKDGLVVSKYNTQLVADKCQMCQKTQGQIYVDVWFRGQDRRNCGFQVGTPMYLSGIMIGTALPVRGCVYTIKPDQDRQFTAECTVR